MNTPTIDPKYRLEYNVDLDNFEIGENGELVVQSVFKVSSSTDQDLTKNGFAIALVKLKYLLSALEKAPESILLEDGTHVSHQEIKDQMDAYSAEIEKQARKVLGPA